MFKKCAVAFKSANKALAYETRLKTLDLYKSLLKSSSKHEHADLIKDEIRKRFKKNRHCTSRTKVLSLLSEAAELEQRMEQGHEFIAKQQIMNLLQKYKKTVKHNPEAPPSVEKKKKLTTRKSYQVAITTQQSSGIEFKRVRGWVQPVRTSMMLKNKVKAIQARLDRFYEYKSQLEMIRSERVFLETLGCLPDDRLMGFEENIKLAMDFNTVKMKNKIEVLVE